MAGVRLTLTAAVLLAAPGAARAGEAACWFEGGVVVASAEVAGIAGDFIIDTGSPRTLIDETRAQAAGFEATEIEGAVRLAGVSTPLVSAAVQGLDVRTWNLPTAVAGVIGADVLKGFVVDLSFAPCRLRLSPPGQAPRLASGHALPLTWDAGTPAVTAAVEDGTRRIEGPFAIATGQNVAVRLANDLAAVPGAEKPNELLPEGVWLARLPELDFAGERLADLGAGLMKPQGGLAGVIGGQVLAGYRLRFDFPAGMLWVSRK